ncbi:hypothetical protein HZZ00_11005 [Streptomyces sp. NEAU-sy36]|uniref:hypothetical protein n=1 Tax=unclassified Streptomyces TaxID=2593676 RepID=UPI0015D611DA|nr:MULTISPECIES: hypothetical protein [unclassified Streptomyces]QLJ01499.1 hypothetical protein HZZ00_11005 [Streptomyces sp. NEAU-sy36]
MTTTPRKKENSVIEQTNTHDHYEDCPQYSDPTAPHCHCDGINQANENYWAEPPNFNG